MFILKCPSCSQQVNIAPEFAGTSVKCPVCGTQLSVPGVANSQPTPATQASGTATPPPIPDAAGENASSFAATSQQRTSSMNFSPQWNDVKNAGASTAGTWSSTMAPPIPAGTPAASRLVYIILAIFLGIFGVHNFVIGLSGRGAAQLAIGGTGVILLPCTGGLSFLLVLAAFIWSVVDIVTITADAKGVPLN